MTLRQILSAIIATAALSAVIGFDFPGGDLLLIIPRILQRNDPSLFVNDLYFSAPAQSYEFVAFIMEQLSKIISLSFTVFFISVITHFLLILSVWRTASFILKRSASFITVLFIILFTGPLLMANIITNSQYHPQFTSYALFFLGLSFVIERKLYTALIFIALSAIFHPLIGLYSLLFVAMCALTKEIDIKDKVRVAALAFVIFFITIVPSLKSSGIDLTASLWRNYVNILIYIRAPHHHLPYVWGAADISRSIVIVFIGLLLAIKSRRFILATFIISLALCIIGIGNNISIQIPKIVIAYPARMAQVLMFLFWVLMAVAIEKMGEVFINKTKNFKARNVLLAMMLLVVIFFAARARFPGNFSFSNRPDPSWLQVSQETEKRIDKDSVVIIPPEKSDFQFLSKRSAYVTVKHFPFSPVRSIEWLKRINSLGLVKTPEDILELRKPIAINTNMYKKITCEAVREINQIYPSVKYCITDKNDHLPFHKVYENRKYTLYSIVKPKGVTVYEADAN